MGMARNARSQTEYDIKEQDIYQQTGSSSLITGYSPLGYLQPGFNASINTGGASLSAIPTLTLPGG